MAATLRSRKISLNICLQGIEQLSREYSKEEQTDIINNMKTKIYFPGSSGESGGHFTEMAGRSTSKQNILRYRMMQIYIYYKYGLPYLDACSFKKLL